MLLLLPVGHSATIRSFPWVTAAIVASCLAIQVASSLSAPTEAEVEQVLRPLYELKRAQSYAIAGQPPPSDLRVEVPSDAAELQKRIAELQTQADAILEHADIALALAYRYGSGVTVKLLTSAFAHGGWLHLIGNMLFLYLCGCNLEDRWGRFAFLGFYLAGALVSASVPAFLHRHDTAHALGASGAIAACMGAFIIFFSSTQITIAYAWLNIFRPKFGTFQVSAIWALGLWFLFQLWDFSSELSGNSGGVSYSAHVSGFLFGAALALGLKQLGYDAKLVQAADGPGNWEESPEIAQAMALLNKGLDHDALNAFKSLRRRLPRDRAVLHELHALGTRLPDRDALELTTSDMVLELIRNGEPGDALDSFRRAEHAAPELPLTDRALAQLAKAAFDKGDAPLGVQLTNRLVRGFPKSPVLPSAMVEVARAQLRAGKSDQAKRTLESVIQRYPLDPFADEAKRMLEDPSLDSAVAL